MKNVVFAEITDREGAVVNNIEFAVPKRFLYFNHVDDLADNGGIFDFLNEIIHKIVYEYFDGGKDLDIIHQVAVTFVNDDRNFICSFNLYDIEEEFDEDEEDFYLNYKIGIIDWENSGYIFKYADDVDGVE